MRYDAANDSFVSIDQSLLRYCRLCEATLVCYHLPETDGRCAYRQMAKRPDISQIGHPGKTSMARLIRIRRILVNQVRFGQPVRQKCFARYSLPENDESYAFEQVDQRASKSLTNERLKVGLHRLGS